MQIANFVLGSNVFVISGSTCTSQYDPNGALQCSLASSLCQDTNSHELHVLDIPDFTGNEFIHITQKCNNSITINCDSFLQGRVLNVPLALSLITLIFRSTSPTCSRAAVVFNATWGIIVLSFSISRSINVVCKTNPAVP